MRRSQPAGGTPVTPLGPWLTLTQAGFTPALSSNHFQSARSRNCQASHGESTVRPEMKENRRSQTASVDVDQPKNNSSCKPDNDMKRSGEVDSGKQQGLQNNSARQAKSLYKNPAYPSTKDNLFSDR